MLGLFGTLNLGARSLQAQQTGVEVAGQNLANINNTAYARQRIQLQTSLTIPTAIGPQGTGAQVVSIEQIRNTLLDGQIQAENSVGGYWNAQQSWLQNAQTELGQFLNQSSSSVDNTANAGSSSTAQGISDQLNGLFNAFKSLATDPSSLTARQALVNQAQTLASGLNQTVQRIDSLTNTLNNGIYNDAASANQLLAHIADLNDQIARSELATGGTANDLRDLREADLEDLAKIVSFDTSTATDGSVNISINGNPLVTGKNVVDTILVYPSGTGNVSVETATTNQPLTMTGGSIQGALDTRENVLDYLTLGLNNLASAVITQVNSIYSTGYDLNGNTGGTLFTGTDARTIGVNNTVVTDPRAIQAAGVAGAPGDNSVALALGQLSTQTVASLYNQSFSSYYAQQIQNFGTKLSDANGQVANYDAVNSMLLKQRDSVSGVSLEEEMTSLIMFQKAYQASSKIITTVDQMLSILVNLKS
ncbi:MAG: flagellar hook-associated protein FlgK [Verrucomicrobiota bacterium]